MIMERGFLSSGSMDKKDIGEGLKNDSLLGDIAKKVKSIDGRMIGKDGKPLRTVKRVILQDTINDYEVSMSDVQHSNDDGLSNTSAKGEKNETGAGASFASLLRPKEVPNMAAANKVKRRYENSIVGFFVGKDPAFQVVQNYAKNTWTKFGFEKITRNDDEVYLFKFASKYGEVTKVPVWVKLYNVPVLAYSEDGLSLIASQIGKPIMLDAFTSSMCVDSWGRISFARALIEISSDSILKKEVIMAIPEEEGDDHIKEVIRVEYEWKPPHCVNCKSFGHGTNSCPKRNKEDVYVDAKNTSSMEEHEEGFVEVKRRNKGNDISRASGGTRLPKPKNFQWQQKQRVSSKEGSNGASSSHTTKKGDVPSIHYAKPDLNTSNSFEMLNVVEEDSKVSEQNTMVVSRRKRIGKLILMIKRMIQKWMKNMTNTPIFVIIMIFV
ncbi:putative reverse transcriptase domain, reverse transcriptase zinc-binding domain protein [Tanacetum coccineum]